MNYKVLVTCPPMLKQIQKFNEKFEELKIDITTPNIIQTMSEDELVKILPYHHGWIIGDDPATFKVLNAGKEGLFRCAVKWGIGTDNIDFNACNKLSIPIQNTPGMFGSEVADLAMCYILGLARDAFLIDREVRKGNWLKLTGISLKGKKIGIVGLGDIGKNIAKRANAHEFSIIGWDPNANDLPSYVNHIQEWPMDIETCDFLVFACALNKKTHHIFNSDILKAVKKGVRIVNISRGQLIDEKALLEGLQNKIITSVALDVFESEPLSNKDFLSYDNCIYGSHNGSNTIDAVTRASEEAISILYKMLKKEIKS